MKVRELLVELASVDPEAEVYCRDHSSAFVPVLELVEHVTPVRVKGGRDENGDRCWVRVEEGEGAVLLE